MKCKHCGMDNYDWVAKCGRCGATVGSAASPEAPPRNDRPQQIQGHGGTCDICGRSISRISDGYALYSEAKLIFGTVGNVLTCSACCEKVMLGLSQDRDIRGMIALFGGDATEGMVADGVVRRCRSMGLTTNDARRIGRELAQEVERDYDEGSTKALRYWYGA
jgi:hypothetical protein